MPHLSFHFVVTPALFLASNSYSLSRSCHGILNGPLDLGGATHACCFEIVLGIDNLVFIAILADKLRQNNAIKRVCWDYHWR